MEGLAQMFLKSDRWPGLSWGLLSGEWDADARDQDPSVPLGLQEEAKGSHEG